METPTTMRHRVFLDAAYAIALSVPRDQYHQRAVSLADELETSQTRLITTRAVLLEIGNALSKQRHRQAAVKLLQAIEADPNVKIVSLTEKLYKQALHLYCSRPDKDWGLTDCISFVVMREQQLVEALTTDTHFEQAGFRALLLENNTL
ncbi:MAG: PIN domain-containing protein [Anaerolineae bacterium]